MVTPGPHALCVCWPCQLISWTFSSCVFFLFDPFFAPAVVTCCSPPKCRWSGAGPPHTGQRTVRLAALRLLFSPGSCLTSPSSSAGLLMRRYCLCLFSDILNTLKIEHLTILLSDSAMKASVRQLFVSAVLQYTFLQFVVLLCTPLL